MALRADGLRVVINYLENLLAAAEAYLFLRRVDVHVHVVRRQLQQHGPLAVCRALRGCQRRADSRVLHSPPVDEEHHDDAPRVRNRVPPDTRGDCPLRRSGIENLSLLPPAALDALGYRRGGGIFEDFPSLFLHAEGDFGVYKGVVVDYLDDAAQLRRGAFKKLAPRRKVEEKVVYLYPRPGLRRRL